MERTFGEFFKQKRLDKNLTQKDIANHLFVSESAVSKWEKNIAHPDITLLPKLANLLDVTEHELITASLDNKSREEKIQAKKWRALSFSWSLFFYIAYCLALIPCFIVDLALNKTLTWFWIVIASLLLSFTFTNLPKLIKKHKLLILPASMYTALVLLLGIASIYTNGDWFIIPVISVLFAMIIVFVPIYISKYKIFEKLRKYNDFISVAIDFILLNILLIVVDNYCVSNGYCLKHWYCSLGLPISLICYLILNIIMCVRFIKVNKLLKSSFILYFIDFLYLIVPFIKKNNISLQQEICNFNIFKADFSNWKVEITLEQNVNLIIFLTILGIATIFFVFGLIKHIRKRNKTTKI